jgi:hypothetical protein
MKREMDLFPDSPPVPAELLQRGLHPPLAASGRHLVWGFALLAAARAAGVRQLACRRLGPLPPAQMLGLALRLENRAGSFSWREKENLLAYARGPGRSEEGPLRLAPLAPLIEGHEDAHLDSRLERYASLPAASKRLVAAGQLDLKSARLLGQLPAQVLEIAGSAPLTFSRRRQFLLLLREVARREQLPSAGVTALAARLLAAPRPLAALEGLRFPMLTALRERFEELAAALWRGSGVRVEPPPYFEGGTFSVRLEFASPESLRRKIAVLRKIQGQADELFELLR